ncbi:hypothetical protein BN1232_05470 [Mycobacterium lentiflavum]|uniref:Uncharacterized protein n=1 Tax=Mycobacterium lentiflavum TaxID=141349 RepID=A0A0E3WDX3_MYCLN|nr:hypothetical protein BN1232_05470 [Mycobacterium lentiflavum]
MQLIDEFEATLIPEIDIDERHVGPQLFDTLQALRERRCHRDDVDSLMLEQPFRRIEEIAIVVDDDAPRSITRCHEFSLG